MVLTNPHSATKNKKGCPLAAIFHLNQVKIMISDNLLAIRRLSAYPMISKTYYNHFPGLVQAQASTFVDYWA